MLTAGCIVKGGGKASDSMKTARKALRAVIVGQIRPTYKNIYIYRHS